MQRGLKRGTDSAADPCWWDFRSPAGLEVRAAATPSSVALSSARGGSAEPRGDPAAAGSQLHADDIQTHLRGFFFFCLFAGAISICKDELH